MTRPFATLTLLMLMTSHKLPASTLCPTCSFITD
jgi:hypothetical protein